MDVKNYGESILFKTVEDKIKGFDSEPSEELSETELNELKSAGSDGPTIIERDLYTGIKTEVPVSDEIDPVLSEEDDAMPVSIKSFSVFALNDLAMVYDKDIEDIKKDVVPGLEERFNDITPEKNLYYTNSARLDEFNNLFGSDLIESMKSKIVDSELDLLTIIRRLYTKLYESYNVKESMKDDIETLDKMLDTISNLKMPDLESDDIDETTVNKYVEAMSMQDTLSKFLNKSSKLDARLIKKSRVDYNIDDIDVAFYNELLNLVKGSMEYRLFYEAMTKTDRISKLKFDISKKITVAEKNICNWLYDLMNDELVMYTLPIKRDPNLVPGKHDGDDELTKNESYNSFKSFIVSAMLREEFGMDLDNVSDDEISTINKKVILFMLLLTKEIPYNKVKGHTGSAGLRRLLSYTLDVISRSTIQSYREQLCRCINVLYDVTMLGKDMSEL